MKSLRHLRPDQNLHISWYYKLLQNTVPKF